MEKQMRRGTLKRRPESPYPKKEQRKRGRPGADPEEDALDPDQQKTPPPTLSKPAAAATTTTTSITDLPDELLEEIFKCANLAPTSGPPLPLARARAERRARALWSVCLTSRRFHRIATPLLYAWYADRDSLGRRLFLRRICREQEQPEDASTPPSPGQQDQIAHRIRHLTLRLEGDAYATQAFAPGEAATLFAAAARVDDILSKERWLQQQHTAPQPLSKLHTLILATEGYLQLLALQDFLLLPSLRTLELWTPEAEEDDASEWPSRVSPIEHVTIGPRVVDDEFIKGLLSSCRALRRFTYAIGRNLLSQGQWKCEAVDMDALHAALLPHQATLSHLAVEGDRRQQVLSSHFRLAGFAALTHLSLSFAAFIAMGGPRWSPLEALPRGIEAIRLDCFGEHWLTLSAFLSDLVEHYRDDFPRFTLLELFVDDSAFYFMRDKLDFLPNRLVWAGVELRLDERPKGDNFLYLRPDKAAPGTCSVLSTLRPDDLSKPPRGTERKIHTWTMVLPARPDLAR
ncbi:hypothetical protein MPH_09332 [Macrophomina phaseolina MS6]|uniref:Uncharacterized protein n=1 Tax=Macrophomina phaseolina (strain MS6) TaxID=1126212 RepID=K2S9G2_MACPH|nr:hypothetical protein MPH_09332 [Macrophomina phaseolina MS6]